MRNKEAGVQSRNNLSPFEITSYIYIMDITNIISLLPEEQSSVSVTQISCDLGSLTALLHKFVQVGELTFEEDKKLLGFFMKYKDTNNLVFYALKSMKEEPSLCCEEFNSLLDAANGFLSYTNEHQELSRNLEFQSNCKRYLAPYEEEHNQSMKYANECWKAFQGVSNKLDYLDERADDYDELVRDLNEKELRYKSAHARVDETYSILQEKRKDIYALYSFDFNMLLIVVDKLKRISLSVINDLNQLKKGDCAHD